MREYYTPNITISEKTTSKNCISIEEISAICSNLAKGCEKQKLFPEMKAFNTLAAYFDSKDAYENEAELFDKAVYLNGEVHLKEAEKLLARDMEKMFQPAKKTADEYADRGALRSLTWSEKVSSMMKHLFERYRDEGESMLMDNKIHVCDICGFIYLGNTLPDVCPVCKVPKYKMIEIE